MQVRAVATAEELELGARDEDQVQERTFEDRISKVMRNILRK